MLLALVLAAAAPAGLPSTIDIPTRTQAVNLFGEYALDGGLLYHRKGDKAPWALVDGVGLPNLDGKVLPQVKGKLTRVFADGNVVAVVDEDDQVFRFDINLHVLDFEPTLYAWRTEWGGPGMLKLRKDLRSVSYGRRSILNVGVVEDRFGHRMLASNPSSLISFFHENGTSGLMHFYGLSQDGRRLFFADNGLTEVFNYEFDLPAAEDFKGVAVTSSASMVVVLDTLGRFWAKFLDFDWAGSNPMMFEYSYVDDDAPPKDDELEGFGRIHLPLPDWRELPALSPPPGASWSSEMGMAVTGNGNEARELRVRGKDAHGACGLWVLDLAGPQRAGAWRFRETGICPAAPFVPAEREAKVKRTKTLAGTLVFDGARLPATLERYSLVDSPARLTLRDPHTGEAVFRGKLHLVTAWSPARVQDPGRDGRYKMFYATVEADEGFADSAFARAYNLQAFALTAYGAQDEVVLKPLRKDALMGKLVDKNGGFPDEVAAYIFHAPRGVRGACDDVRARVAEDQRQFLEVTAATPALNLFGLVTGTRFWYYHGVSMIPPLGRMMDWGTRLFYDRYRLSQLEMSLVDRHCAAE